MESIREMVDVNTVIGDPVKTQDGSTIIPISKVSFGFVAGGGEYECGAMQMPNLPFAGGAGAGVTVHPMGFLVCSTSGVRMLSAGCTSPVDKLVEMIPQALEMIGTKEHDEKKNTCVSYVDAVYHEE